MEIPQGKRKCEFGASCYRKNPNHLKLYWHPDESAVGHDNKRHKAENTDKKLKNEEMKKKIRQTTLNFSKKAFEEKPEENQVKDGQAEVGTDVERTASLKKDQEKVERKHSISSSEDELTNSKLETKDENKSKDEEELSSSSDEGTLQKTSWTYIKKTPETDTGSASDQSHVTSVEDGIKQLFLVEMPPDFYEFFEFCKTISKDPVNALNVCGLKLVGPYQVLSGEIRFSKIRKAEGLCLWRYFYDPPEYQTILAAENGVHIGFWRDDPNTKPVFLASNNSNECIFKIEGDNIFGAVFNYISTFVKTCDPFVKIKALKLQGQIAEQAKKLKYVTDTNTASIKERQKKVVSKTFHRAGLVVPVERKTEIGYRPLIETEANIKKMCKAIINSKTEAERKAPWESLQALVTAANIANDECDFGNSLELGINLFCMGSSLFHNTVEHLCTTAYTLLDRPEFASVIKAHLQTRSKDVIKNLT